MTTETSFQFFFFILQDKNRGLFVDFVSKLLTIDPDGRPSADEALSHPWIKSSLDRTEDDIRYRQG
jgi:serine/threonine protein kinase